MLKRLIKYFNHKYVYISCSDAFTTFAIKTTKSWKPYSGTYDLLIKFNLSPILDTMPDLVDFSLELPRALHVRYSMYKMEMLWWVFENSIIGMETHVYFTLTWLLNVFRNENKILDYVIWNFEWNTITKMEYGIWNECRVHF
jgi:hypothetical protein